MSWDDIILETTGPVPDLRERLEGLFEQQRQSFPLLREGEASLATMRVKEFFCEDGRVVVQANPGRRGSTHAKVDPDSVAKRPCFLCPDNIPREERGIAFGGLVLLPNPYPVLPRHCTVPVREHVPQRLAGRIGLLLELAGALGPSMLVFYNGARCGASAPDHFHFQACASAGVPLLDELGADAGPAVESFGRRMLVLEDADAGRVEERIRRALDLLAGDEEPMVNVLATFRGGRHLAVVFPRARHRPACYFAEGDACIAVSPAALEMAGLLVVAEPEHIDRVDASTARSIYEEVSLDPGRFARLAGEVA